MSLLPDGSTMSESSQRGIIRPGRLKAPRWLAATACLAAFVVAVPVAVAAKGDKAEGAAAASTRPATKPAKVAKAKKPKADKTATASTTNPAAGTSTASPSVSGGSRN